MHSLGKRTDCQRSREFESPSLLTLRSDKSTLQKRISRYVRAAPRSLTRSTFLRAVDGVASAPRCVRVSSRAWLTLVFVLSLTRSALAGPPYQTDDPEPVDYKNWEIYVAWDYASDAGDALTSAVPAFELDYGLLPNLQVSAATQFAYTREVGSAPSYSFSDSQFGVKYRFVRESASRPQVAIYPQILLPAGGNQPARTFLPIWLEKTSGPWTVFGGGGFWHDSGSSPHDWTYVGVAVTRKLSPTTSLGTEIFRNGEDRTDGTAQLGFNIGLTTALRNHRSFLFSVGRALHGDNALSGYTAYQFTVGPDHAR